MIKFSGENREVLNPAFVASTLKGIPHRFVFVLEVECRLPPQVGVVPPHYSIAGQMASMDPLKADYKDLIPLTKHKLELVKQWEKIHQFIYILSPDTDEHGWQYRSHFPEYAAEAEAPLQVSVNDTNDIGYEPWTKENSPGCNVRRRVWMTTIGRADQLVFSKKKLAESLISKRSKFLIMEGELLRHELTPGTLTKTWQKRYIYLYTNTVEIYTVSKQENGRKLAEIQLPECECHILFGSQSNDRPFAFSLSHHSRSTALAVFDAENRDIRRRWCVAIRYQIALLTPDVNFFPFDYAPPTGDDPSLAVLMCGELDRLSYDGGRNWSKSLIVLRSTEFSLFTGTELEGNYSLAGAEVTPLEGSLEFTVKSGAKICVLRAANASIKSSWLRAICRQIAILGRRGHSVVATLRVKSNSSTPTGTGPNSVKSNTSTPNSVMQMGFFPSSPSVSSASGPMTPTNANALVAAHNVAATIHAVSDKLFSASPLPNPKTPGSTNSSTPSTSENVMTTAVAVETEGKQKTSHKPKAHAHDVDMFGEMDVIEEDSTHGGADYSDSDEDNDEKSSVDNDARATGSDTRDEEASETAPKKRIQRAGTGYVHPPTHHSPILPAPIYTSSPINVNAKHSYVPTNTPRTLPKSPSTLMRAASMKVLSTPKRDEDEYALGTMALSSSPPSRLSTLQEKAVSRQSSVLQKVLTLESRIEEKKDERLSRSFYIPSTSKPNI